MEKSTFITGSVRSGKTHMIAEILAESNEDCWAIVERGAGSSPVDSYASHWLVSDATPDEVLIFIGEAMIAAREGKDVLVVIDDVCDEIGGIEVSTVVRVLDSAGVKLLVASQSTPMRTFLNRTAADVFENVIEL